MESKARIVEKVLVIGRTFSGRSVENRQQRLQIVCLPTCVELAGLTAALKKETKLTVVENVS